MIEISVMWLLKHLKTWNYSSVTNNRPLQKVKHPSFEKSNDKEFSHFNLPNLWDHARIYPSFPFQRGWVQPESGQKHGGLGRVSDGDAHGTGLDAAHIVPDIQWAATSCPYYNSLALSFPTGSVFLIGERISQKSIGKRVNWVRMVSCWLSGAIGYGCFVACVIYWWWESSYMS